MRLFIEVSCSPGNLHHPSAVSKAKREIRAFGSIIVHDGGLIGGLSGQAVLRWCNRIWFLCSFIPGSVSSLAHITMYTAITSYFNMPFLLRALSENCNITLVITLQQSIKGLRYPTHVVKNHT